MTQPPDRPLPADERPLDTTPIHTEDLPPTPTRDRNIVASAWIEAPAELLTLGDDLPLRTVRWSPPTSVGSAPGCCGASDPPRVPTPATSLPTTWPTSRRSGCSPTARVTASARAANDTPDSGAWKQDLLGRSDET